MKRLSCFLIGLLSLSFFTAAVRAQSGTVGGFGATHRFMFYAVLEGCYEDGLSSNDVAQVLLQNTNEFYSHFIYSCPLCMPALHAFEAYREHPSHFTGYKNPKSTFGPGLDPDLRKQLYSEKAEDRLTAINTLIQRWVKNRIAMQRLTPEEREALQQELEGMRKKGSGALERFVKDGQAGNMAPAYGKTGECAICNGAVGMALPRLETP